MSEGKNHNILEMLSSLSQYNLEKVYSMVKDIEDKMQLASSPNICIHWKSNYDTELIKDKFLNWDNYLQMREEVLNFLLNKGVVNSFKYNQIIPRNQSKLLFNFQGHPGPYSNFEILLDVKNFKKFESELLEYWNNINSNKDNSINTNFDISNDTKWEDIEIHFKDGLTVDIIIKGKKYNKTCRELGFEDKKKLRPNQQWILLKSLAEKHGTISWNDSNAHPRIKSQKHLLSKNLKECFGIDEDPFYPYSKDVGYQIKIALIPED